MWSRIHLIPVLQAEEDRDLVRRHLAEKARERELLGAETKVYNNDRCVCGAGGPTRCLRSLYGLLTLILGSCGQHMRLHRAAPQSSVDSRPKGGIVHITAFKALCRPWRSTSISSKTAHGTRCYNTADNSTSDRQGGNESVSDIHVMAQVWCCP